MHMATDFIKANYRVPTDKEIERDERKERVKYANDKIKKAALLEKRAEQERGEAEFIKFECSFIGRMMQKIDKFLNRGNV